jgi:hypothetical protein
MREKTIENLKIAIDRLASNINQGQETSYQSKTEEASSIS